VLHFRPAVVLEAIELRHRIAALERDRTRGPCSPIVRIGCFGSCSRAGGRFASNAGRGGLPLVRCTGQRGKAFLQKARLATSGGRSFGELTAYPGGEIRTPKLRRMFDVTRFRA
jgi:hypothetical protein